MLKAILSYTVNSTTVWAVADPKNKAQEFKVILRANLGYETLPKKKKKEAASNQQTG